MIEYKCGNSYVGTTETRFIFCKVTSDVCAYIRFCYIDSKYILGSSCTNCKHWKKV